MGAGEQQNTAVPSGGGSGPPCPDLLRGQWNEAQKVPFQLVDGGQW